MFKSKELTTCALAYEDKLVEDNPQTYDEVVLCLIFVSLPLILISLEGISILPKKKKLFN